MLLFFCRFGVYCAFEGFFFAYVREWVRSLVTFFGGTFRLVFLASH